MADKKILKVFDQEGLYKTMAVEPSTAAGEICDKFAKKLFINESERVQFSLFIIEGGVKQKLKVTDFPFDFLVKLENKTDYKFYFLNPNGEYISFNPDKTKGNTASTSNGSNNSGSNSPSTKPPSKTVTSRPGKGMSGILLRKKANRFEECWAVSKDKYLIIYSSQDDDTPLFELSLENAVIELKAGGNSGSPQIVLTLSNSERHTFTSDKDSEISAWATELQCTTAYTASQTSKVATPAMAFIPTARDLNVKLQSKLENNEVQGRAIISWINYLMSGRQLKVSDDIMTAFSDGNALINLIELLFGKTLKYRKGKSIYEMQYNVDACLDSLRDVGADFGKMISQDIVECKVIKVILRLLWSIFVAFATNGEKEYVVKDKMVGWAGRKVNEYNKSIPVDSASALQNPLVFAALLAKHNPSAIDFNSVSSKKSKEEQAKMVLDAAFEKCKIPKILEPSFFKEDNQDEKSYLLYLSLFYYTFSNEDKQKADIILVKSQQSSQAVEPENTMSQRDKLLKQQQQAQQEKADTVEKDRLEKEKQLEKVRLEKERLEKERLEIEEQERIEQDRIEREEEERLQQEREREEEERLEREEEERLKEERLQQEREEEEREQREQEEKEERQRLQKQQEEDEEIEKLKREHVEDAERQREQQKENELNEEVEESNTQESNDINIKTSSLQYDEDDEDDVFNSKNLSNKSISPISSASISNPNSSLSSSSGDITKEYQNRKFTKPLPVPSAPQPQPQQRQSTIVEEVDEFVNVEQYDAISPDKSNDNSDSNSSLNNNNKPISRAIARICLEGFGEVLFCSFAIGSDTLCGNVRQMVIKKMKVPKEEEPEYFLYIVRDGLERVLDDDEILLEAEDKVDRFVFKKNDIERKYLLSNHRG